MHILFGSKREYIFFDDDMVFQFQNSWGQLKSTSHRLDTHSSNLLKSQEMWKLGYWERKGKS